MGSLSADKKRVLRGELETIVGPGAVLSDPDELMVYESDGLTLFRALADFVVFPTSADHVSAVVKLANREKQQQRAEQDDERHRLLQVAPAAKDPTTPKKD